MVLPYRGKSPRIAKECFVAESAALVGDIDVGEASSIWFGVSVRAENGQVRIGQRVNIQDNSVLHVDADGECVIGNGVSIGHGAIVHGATVGENSLIGMGAVLLNDSKIGRNCVVGAGTLITQGTDIPDGSLVLGSPGIVKRKLTAQEIEAIRANAASYDALRSGYLATTRKV
ncbi:MAG: gamma carbonic anhydrase family protein [Nitrososphaerota archaeon]|nr:gamma carbonic anhydrase family protein [Nitrososphaerota archaeon]